MITKEGIADAAKVLSADVVHGALEIVNGGNANTKPEETEATLAIVIATSVALQAYLLHCLPEQAANSMRAAMDRMASEINKQKKLLINPEPLFDFDNSSNIS